MTKEVNLDIPADYFQSEESREHVSRQFQRAIDQAYEAGKQAAAEPVTAVTKTVTEAVAALLDCDPTKEGECVFCGTYESSSLEMSHRKDCPWLALVVASSVCPEKQA